MKLGIKSVVAGVSTLAVTGALLVAGGGVANAVVPPFDPAGNGATQGTLSLYDASGNKVTSGPIASPPAYAKADADNGRPGDTLATLYAATPQLGVNPGLWPNGPLSVSAAYPTAAAGVPASLQNQPTALARQIFLWLDPSGWPADFPNTNSDPAWQDLYQLRMYTSGPGQSLDSSRYSSATIRVDGSTWTQVFPEPVATPTTTSLSASPASPQDSGTSIDLSATVDPAAAVGSVEFFDGATSLGTSPVAGGAATQNGVNLSVGSHSLTAVFTPSNPADYAASTSSALSYQINQAPAAATTTSLSVNPTSGPAYANVALHADVVRTSNGNALGGGNGTVKFFDGATQIGQSPLTASGADLAYNNFAPGGHSLTAQFVPADPQTFGGSTSPVVSPNYDAPACTQCVDPQTVVVNVPAGGLSITTPYTPSNPFSLGDMALDSNGIGFSASKQFPGAGEVLAITDTRAGDLPWTAYVTSTDFTNAGSGVIDAAGLSYTNVVPSYIAGNALNAATKPVATSNVASVKGGPHQFASTVHGSGSVYIDGVLGLTAPSSTPAGLYTATVTFTIA